MYHQGFVGLSGCMGNHKQTKETMGTIGTRSLLDLFMGLLQQASGHEFTHIGGPFLLWFDLAMLDC